MYKCLNCKNISFKPINTLIGKFSNTYKLCNNDNKRFVLLLRKGVYPYEYMDNIMGIDSIKYHYHQKKNFTVV